MSKVLLFHFLQFGLFLLWASAIAHLSFITAPTAFQHSPTRDDAGAITRNALRKTNIAETAFAVMLVLTSVALAAASIRYTRLLLAKDLVLGGMVFLLVIYAYVLAPKLQRIRQNISTFTTEEASPDREEFDRYHRIYVKLYGTTMLMGLAGAVLTCLSVRNNGV